MFMVERQRVLVFSTDLIVVPSVPSRNYYVREGLLMLLLARGLMFLMSHERKPNSNSDGAYLYFRGIKRLHSNRYNGPTARHRHGETRNEVYQEVHDGCSQETADITVIWRTLHIDTTYFIHAEQTGIFRR